MKAKRNISILLTIIFLASFIVGCSHVSKAEGKTNAKVTELGQKKNGSEKGENGCENKNMYDKEITEVSNFGLNLLKSVASKSEKNSSILISPISIISVLGMSANGANGETLKEFEKSFGMTSKELNNFMKSYKKLPSEDGYKVNQANSIWLKKNFNPSKEFLKSNKDYYEAEIKKANFNARTVKEINKWVEKETLGMIDSIIDNISKDDVMILVNAIAFDGKWEVPFEKSTIEKDDFNKESGAKSKVEFMRSVEKVYIKGEKEVGFKKDYKEGKYSFVALLPNDKTGIEKYLETLSGEKLQELLKTVEKTKVDVKIPKFNEEFKVILNNHLNNIGIKKAFTNEAEFKKIGNVKISQVLHKTFIELDEKGTKAAAVTGGVFETTSVGLPNPSVELDRPFVYIILDNENNIPMFLGIFKG